MSLVTLSADQVCALSLGFGQCQSITSIVCAGLCVRSVWSLVYVGMQVS